jgi:uncharacterized membrane protein
LGTIHYADAIEHVGKAIDLVGVAAIVVGGLAATVTATARRLHGEPHVYREFRRSLGRSILLGLELLVAADIVRTVAISPTLESVTVLAGIVLIRTVLSFTLEVEINGRWPWQRTPQTGEDA